MSFSDNWFRREEWCRLVEQDREQAKCDDEAKAKLISNAAEWIKCMSPLCKHVSYVHANAAIAAGLVTEQEVEAAGIQR